MSWFYCFFESGSNSVTQADLNILATFLAQPSNTRIKSARHKIKLYMYVCVCQHMCVTDRWKVEDNFQKFSSSTVCSGLELGFSGLVAKCPYLLSSLPGPVVILKLYILSRPGNTSL